jgi:hypothetical protein
VWKLTIGSQVRIPIRHLLDEQQVRMGRRRHVYKQHADTNQLVLTPKQKKKKKTKTKTVCLSNSPETPSPQKNKVGLCAKSR